MTGRELEAVYPRLEDYREVLTELDPNGKFRNDFLDQMVFGLPPKEKARRWSAGGDFDGKIAARDPTRR